MSNKVWMSGCLNVWMSGCLDVWMSGCLNVWMSGCLDVWMSERLNVWISDCLNVWLSDCLCFSTSRHSDNQASRHSDIQTSRHSDIQTSMLQMSRKERTNLEDIIRDSMRSWSSPRPSRIAKTHSLSRDSRFWRGAGSPKKSPNDEDIFKICTSFPGHPH